jgi:hypothetical protein
MLLRQGLVALALALLAACGGGGGSQTDKVPPVISNFVYSQTAVYQNSGGGQVDVNGTFTVTGANGGFGSVTVEVIDSTDATSSSTTTPVANGAGITRGTIQGSLSVGTSVPGTYTIKVRLTDLAGLTSNTLSGGFRIATFPWVAKTAMPETRDYFAVATVGGLAYVVGGEVLGTGVTPGPPSSRVDVYNPATDQWSSAPSMPTARIEPAVAVAGGLLYLIGGRGPTDLATVEAFNPASGMWASLPPMPTPRHGAAATTVGNQICVFGGTSAGLDVSTTECLDPTSNTWASGLPNMPTFRHGLGADAIAGLAYAVGGYSGGNMSGGGPGYVSTVERYNPATRTWTSNASMLTTREYEGVVTMSGQIYAIGGNNQNRALETVETFDPSTGAWAFKTSMPLPLTRVGAVSIGSVVYVFEQGNTLQYTPANDIL